MQKVNLILDEPDKKIIRKAEKRKLKRYNLSQTAKILGVPRQTLYYLTPLDREQKLI